MYHILSYEIAMVPLPDNLQIILSHYYNDLHEMKPDIAFSDRMISSLNLISFDLTVYFVGFNHL